MRTTPSLRAQLLLLVCASLVPACGGEVDPAASGAGLIGPAGTPAHVYVAAHPDDDLLFMNPDVESAFLSGHAVRTVYVTSGDAGQDASYWQSREDGIRSAYAAMARVADAWSCGTITFAAKASHLCTLSAAPRLSVLFLRLPDAGLAQLWATDGGPPFWVTPVASRRTVDGATDYTRADLVRVLAAVIEDAEPERVGTTDGTLAYGDDHIDHIAVGLFVLDAVHAARGVPEVRMYRGYSVYQTWDAVPEPEARNLTLSQHDAKTRLMTAYSGPPAPGHVYDEWCWRHYSTTSLSGAGALGQAGRCIDVSGGAAVAGAAVVARACSGSPGQRWTVQPDGLVVGLGGLCLTLGPGGTPATLASCTGAPGQTWMLLDNGQLHGASARCITLDGDGVTLRATTCASQQVGGRLRVSATQQWTRLSVPASDAGAPGSLDAGTDAGTPATDAGVDGGVAPPPDAGPRDAGPRDSGPPDSGPRDSGPPDSGPRDSGPPDSGPRDSGPPDAGPRDSGPPDSGPPDSGPPGTRRAHVYFSPHPDDDLLFMNPDIESAFLSGLSVRTVYVTAGDAGQDAGYWQSREVGVRDAYAEMARVSSAWTCGARTYAGRTAQLCTLSARPTVSLLFLRLPDAGLSRLWATDGGPPFWVAPVSSRTTVDGANEYTRADLVRVLAAVIEEAAPERVGSTDGTLAYGDDHTDHIAAGLFVLEAIHAARAQPRLRVYRGYSVYQTWDAVPAPEPRNLSVAEHDEKARLMASYGSPPGPGSLYDEWCWRHYYTTSLSGPGALAQGGRCIDGSAAAVVARTCSGSTGQRWTVQSNGLVVGVGGLCLTLGAGSPSAALATCTGAPEQTWTLLDNGQLHSGAGARCITLDGDGVTLRDTACTSQQVGGRLTVSSSQRWAQIPAPGSED